MSRKPLTGRHVLFMVLGFFAVTITVNAIFVTQAIRHFPGEDVPRSYMQGIAYNDTLDARAAQAALGWTANAEVLPTGVQITIVDADGVAVTGLTLNGHLRHPANTSLDIDLPLTENSAGSYHAVLDIPNGRWRLVVATDGEIPFELEQAVWLR